MSQKKWTLLDLTLLLCHIYMLAFFAWNSKYAFFQNLDIAVFAYGFTIGFGTGALGLMMAIWLGIKNSNRRGQLWAASVLEEVSDE